MIELTRTDPFTGKVNTMSLDVTYEQIDSWVDGELIQNAFPNLTADEREFIQTGITSDSWDKFIGGGDDDDDVTPHTRDDSLDAAFELLFFKLK
jgi:hypothetical protein|tara:strand:+ start:162 stop:443 length:282 start_codon:yes stop_codon:yes gene_type:complete